MRKAEREDGRERQAHEAGARTRATAHERTPQQERQKAAREAERTLGQGMKKPVAGCYGRLTRWKGGGDVVYMALL
ncbi:relaxase [Escherichia coli]|uniref:relaxase n=1 Tax=Escherichia coli TaxID=562 RepID=UPI001C4EF66E|nr:relaxase [Escherichia coli]MBW1164580.1 relaxase [Escherichia coli]HDY1342128.1 relaxase [Escherichia coli]